MNKKSGLLLLDTHIWLWLVSGVSKALSPRLRTLIEEASANQSIRVSSISIWEIGMLAAKKKISFGTDIREWVLKALSAPGLKIEAVGPDVALESTLLPEGFHGDPADRILLATAVHIGATLITHDKEILTYSKKYNFPALSL